jgi:hypothetical protein
MDIYSYIKNASGHLHDFDDSFEEAMTVLTASDQQELASYFSDTLKKFPQSEDMSMDDLSNLLTVLMKNLMHYPKLTELLNLRVETLPIPSTKRITADAFLVSDNPDLKRQSTLAEQAHQLKNTTYLTITRLSHNLQATNKVKR